MIRNKHALSYGRQHRLEPQRQERKAVTDETDILGNDIGPSPKIPGIVGINRPSHPYEQVRGEIYAQKI